MVIPATQGAGKQLDMFAVVWRQMNAGNAPAEDLAKNVLRIQGEEIPFLSEKDLQTKNGEGEEEDAQMGAGATGSTA